LLVALQLIPSGLPVTCPAPVPASATVKVTGGIGVKVAVTLSTAFIVTVQVPVAGHPAPLQPENIEPFAGVAVSVTCDPDAKLALQMAPQVIPEGLLVTVPEPVPTSVIVSRKLGISVKVALTAVSLVRSMTQGLVPRHPPPRQPENIDPAFAVAVRVTGVPPANPKAH
jgi:hypothetical protein